MHPQTSLAEGGEVTGAGDYNLGDVVAIAATPNEGWGFAQWTGDTEHIDNALSPNATVMYTVSGYVIDIFDEFGLENALIKIDDNVNIIETYSDEDGFFLVTVYSSGYLFTTIGIQMKQLKKLIWK